MPEFINFCIGSWRSTFERQIFLLCTGNSFSPVPFIGRFRACRFHSLIFLVQAGSFMCRKFMFPGQPKRWYVLIGPHHIARIWDQFLRLPPRKHGV